MYIKFKVVKYALHVTQRIIGNLLQKKCYI